jgi:predicted DNA-binding transcriptional regulator AlpA
MKKPIKTEPELLTKTDLSNWIQVSGRQIENLVRAKRLPEPIRLGKHPRWRRSELMAFIDGLAADGNADATTGK